MQVSPRPQTEVQSKRLHSRRKLLVAKSLAGRIKKETHSRKPSGTIAKELITSLDGEGILNDKYYQRTTSPTHILFDQNGESLKRSYIGPFKYIKKQNLFNETNPFELIRELKRLGEERKEEMNKTQLSGKHGLASSSAKPDVVKTSNLVEHNPYFSHASV